MQWYNDFLVTFSDDNICGIQARPSFENKYKIRVTFGNYFLFMKYQKVVALKHLKYSVFLKIISVIEL